MERIEMTDDLDAKAILTGACQLGDAFLAWFTAEAASETALQAWWQSTGSSRSTTYIAYRASLDREEIAARNLERLSNLAGPGRSRIAIEGRAL
jgi:hypothetical protein